MIISKQIILLKIFFLVYFIQSIHAKLILLNVIFRHGDRTPDTYDLQMNPNDPYINDTFYPYGLGGLTNRGKQREYNLGQHLRKHYGDFLGETFIVKEVKARSTGIDRTKMSLHLVLAGMYPPARSQRWNPMLAWQPIPTEYIPPIDDTLMIPQQCPKYLRVREKVEQSSEFQELLSKYGPLMKDVTKNTGRVFDNTLEINFLYQTLLAEAGLNLELPAWTFGKFPYGELHDAAVLEYELESFNDEMKRLNGGMLLRKITDDMTEACVGKLNPPRKVFLYSGHESNVAAVLQALGIYYPHIPRYSSAVIMELHERNYGNHIKHFVRVRYYRGYVIPGRGEVLDEVMQVPGAEKLCTIDEFKNALRNVIARDSDIPCNKRSLKTYLESGRSKLPKGITLPILNSIYEEESHQNVLQ